MAKATHEIHASLEIAQAHENPSAAPSFFSVLAQIALVDVIFSIDSVIVAVGLVDQLSIMVIAVCFSVVVMLLAAKPIGRFVDENPRLEEWSANPIIKLAKTRCPESAYPSLLAQINNSSEESEVLDFVYDLSNSSNGASGDASSGAAMNS